MNRCVKSVLVDERFQCDTRLKAQKTETSPYGVRPERVPHYEKSHLTSKHHHLCGDEWYTAKLKIKICYCSTLRPQKVPLTIRSGKKGDFGISTVCLQVNLLWMICRLHFDNFERDGEVHQTAISTCDVIREIRI